MGKSNLQYIILNNEILKSNYNISSEQGVYYTVNRLIGNENNEVNISLLIVKMT